MQSEKLKNNSELILQQRQFDTGLKQRLFIQKVKKHTSKSRSESAVILSESNSSATFGYG